VQCCFQDFFEKRGVAVMTVTELFNFVVDQNIADEDVDDYLEKVCLYFTFSSYILNNLFLGIAHDRA
jgi:hypothetical protein